MEESGSHQLTIGPHQGNNSPHQAKSGGSQYNNSVVNPIISTFSGYLKSLGRNVLFSQQSRICVDVSDFAIWIVTAPHGLSFFDTCRIITLNDHDKYPTLILVFPPKNAKKKQKFTKIKTL